MSDFPADSPALGLPGPVPVGSEPAPGLKPGRPGWSLNRWLTLIVSVFVVHIVLLYVFGTRKAIAPRALNQVPTLKLAGNADELLMLENPTLFALPQAGEFAAVLWAVLPQTNSPAFLGTETPHWLSLSADGLLAVFNQFMQTNAFAGHTDEFKPPLRLNPPASPLEPALAQVSTLRIAGDLMQRRMLTAVDLPSWPFPDVIAPSKVQVLVNEAGDVISTLLLPSDNSQEALGHYELADQSALKFARAARFTPGPHLTVGQMIFTWHTVPPPATNSPATSP